MTGDAIGATSVTDIEEAQVRQDADVVGGLGIAVGEGEIAFFCPGKKVTTYGIEGGGDYFLLDGIYTPDAIRDGLVDKFFSNEWVGDHIR